MVIDRFTKSGLASALIKKMPAAAARSIARRLFTDHPQVFPDIESARNTVRYVLGANGNKLRKEAKDKSLMRTPRTSTKLSLPPSMADPWKPFRIDAPCVVLSLSDVHVPYHDRRAVEAAVAFAKRKFKISHLLLNGDFGDFYSQSRFLKNPTKRRPSKELAAMRQALEWLVGEFPKSDRIYKLGNHDERWDHWVWNHTPEVADCDHVQLHNILEFDKFGFTRVDSRPVMAGRYLPIFHGHEFGKTANNPVNAARGGFLRTLHSGITAHLHSSSNHVQYNVFKKELAFWSQACLCGLWPEYARVNNWNHGFVVIEVAKNHTFNVHNFRMGAGYKVRTA